MHVHIAYYCWSSSRCIPVFRGDDRHSFRFPRVSVFPTFIPHFSLKLLSNNSIQIPLSFIFFCIHLPFFPDLASPVLPSQCRSSSRSFTINFLGICSLSILSISHSFHITSPFLVANLAISYNVCPHFKHYSQFLHSTILLFHRTAEQKTKQRSPCVTV